MSAKEEVFKLQIASKERLVHFLMASAGAATGFCVTLQDSLRLQWPDVLIMLATAMFALSFWAGVRTTRAMQDMLYVNGMYLEDRENLPTEHLREFVKVAAQEHGFEPIQKKIDQWTWIQSFTLISGAITLLLWRIAQGYPDFDLLHFGGGA